MSVDLFLSLVVHVRADANLLIRKEKKNVNGSLFNKHSSLLAMDLTAVRVRKVFKGWDLFVVMCVLMGFYFSRITAFNSSLVFAWLVFLCDLIYTSDALARTSKRVHFSTIATWLSATFSKTSTASSLQLSRNAPLILTFVPYHVLVVLGLDIYGSYMLLCALRAAVLVKSKIAVSFSYFFRPPRRKKGSSI